MKLNKKLAASLARLCLWAYDFDESREEELLNINGELPLSEHVISDGKKLATSFSGIVEYEKFIVVAFQGTITEFGRDGEFRLDSLIDWIQNLRIERLDTNVTGLPGLIHEGFHDQLSLVYGKVTSQLNSLRKKPIIVTGHSQGGAVATIATKKLELDGFDVKQTYTFAAPRAGNAKFVNSIKTPFHRIEFGHDVVPHVPPMLAQKSLLGGFLGKLPRKICIARDFERNQQT